MKVLRFRFWLSTLYTTVLVRVGIALRSVISKESLLGRLLLGFKRRLPTPASKLSVLLGALARCQKPVHFIQVGANDGVSCDPLNPFITKHRWRGVLVEPVKPLFEKLKRNYAHTEGVTFENVAISSTEGIRDFFYVAEQPGERADLPSWHTAIGSLSKDTTLKQANEYPGIARHLVQQQVECITLETLCARNGIDKLHLVLIDAEGHDYEILKSLNSGKHLPYVLIYEHYHMTAEQDSECRAMLSSWGYEFTEDGFDTLCLNLLHSPASYARVLDVWQNLRTIAVPPEPIGFKRQP